MTYNLKNLFKKEVFLTVIFLIAYFSLIIPYKIPLFSLTTVIFFLIYFFNKRIGLYINFQLILIYLMILFYFIGLNLTGGILYNNNLSDIVAIILLSCILSIIGSITKEEFLSFKKSFLNWTSYLIPLVAIFSLYKYYLLLNGKQINYLVVEGRPYPWGTSLMPDYNMFALGMVIGIISLSYFLRNANSIYKQLYGLMGIITVLISIIFAGSRRGWIVTFFILLILLMALIICLFKNPMKKENKRTVNLLLLLFLIFIAYNLLSTNFLNFNLLENTEYQKLQLRFSSISDFNSSFDERTARWEYGIERIEGLSLLEFLFGEGFDYLKDYAIYFNVVNATEDYPHNPLISTFLYSGLIGSIIFIYIIVISVFLLVVNWRMLSFEFLVIFIAMLFFLIPSLNTLFSVKLFWLFIITIFSVKLSMFHKNKSLLVTHEKK